MKKKNDYCTLSCQCIDLVVEGPLCASVNVNSNNVLTIDAITEEDISGTVSW